MKALWIILGIGATVAILAIGLLYGVGFWLSPQDKLTQADVIVAVSGGETDARAEEAVRLYKQGLAPIILFAGAALDTSGPSNAATMRQEALDLGVPSSAILIEESSINTAQNAVAAAPILQRQGAEKVILVTSPYHQRRASINFHRALGKSVQVINHSAPDQSWRRQYWWATPYSTFLTFSELQKTLFVLLNGQAS